MMKFIQVLPLEEDDGQEVKDDLFSLDDVKVEVMRSRGAGGQVEQPDSFSGISHADLWCSTSIKLSLPSG